MLSRVATARRTRAIQQYRRIQPIGGSATHTSSSRLSGKKIVPLLRDAGAERRLREVKSMKPAALAFLGDAVWELACRERSVWPMRGAWSARDAGGEGARLKCAEAQSLLIERMLGENFLLEDAERDWVRRGRNSVKTVPARIPPETYRNATGMEVLLGFLHVTDTDRLAAVLEFAFDSSASLPTEKELLKKRHGRRHASQREAREKDIDANLKLRRRLKRKN